MDQAELNDWIDTIVRHRPYLEREKRDAFLRKYLMQIMTEKQDIRYYSFDKERPVLTPTLFFDSNEYNYDDLVELKKNQWTQGNEYLVRLCMPFAFVMHDKSKQELQTLFSAVLGRAQIPHRVGGLDSVLDSAMRNVTRIVRKVRECDVDVGCLFDLNSPLSEKSILFNVKMGPIGLNAFNIESSVDVMLKVGGRFYVYFCCEEFKQSNRVNVSYTNLSKHVQIFPFERTYESLHAIKAAFCQMRTDSWDIYILSPSQDIVFGIDREKIESMKQSIRIVSENPHMLTKKAPRVSALSGGVPQKPSCFPKYDIPEDVAACVERPTDRLRELMQSEGHGDETWWKENVWTMEYAQKALVMMIRHSNLRINSKGMLYVE